MKKILLSARDLKIGGIEKALISLINYLLEQGYDVTLVLEKKEGELLKNIKDNVTILEYTPSSMKLGLIRKTVNLLKRLKFIIKYANKFDVSISFATYSESGSFVARTASRNSILWCHADYLSLFEGNHEKVEDFFENIYYDCFSKIVFVSESARKTFLEVFPNQKNTYYCNNLVDNKEIYEMTEETIKLKYNQETTTFLNVGRHDEKQKKLSRIIKAAIVLKKENYNFRIIFVGEGQDTSKYIKLVKKYNLQKNIIFVGAKKNPYPYFKIANCVILSSDYEGYPVVFLESYILNKPIITTNVSDYKDIQNGRGIVTSKDVKGIYKAMKSFLDNGYQIKKEFNVIEYNQSIKNKLSKILEKF